MISVEVGTRDYLSIPEEYHPQKSDIANLCTSRHIFKVALPESHKVRVLFSRKVKTQVSFLKRYHLND